MMVPNPIARAGGSGQARLKGLTHALVAAGLVSTLPALAQQAADPEPQTVVITAGKRIEKQREVAGSIAVLQGNDLERRGATGQEDFFKLIPGVQLAKGDSAYNNIVIRGLATSACSVCQGNLQNPAGVYLGDVPLTDPIGKLTVPDILPFDLERIEVLKGPQGALYGSASLGGAVRYLLAQPNLKSLEGTVQVGASSVSKGSPGYSLSGMINAPLSDGVAAIRAVVYDGKEGGYLDNSGTGVKDANAIRHKGARVLGTVQPVKNLSLTLTLMTDELRQDDGNSAVQLRGVPDLDNPAHNAATDSPRTAKFDFSSLVVNYGLAGHTVTSTTGWWKKQRIEKWDLTPLYSTLAFAQTIPIGVVTSLRNGEGKSTSQELRIANDAGGPLSYVAGAIWTRTTTEAVSPNIVTSTLFAPLNSSSTGNSKATEKAIFIDGEYAFGNGWSAGLGARYYRIGANSDNFSGDVVTSTAFDESGTTPKASIKYRFGENLWYALASKGYRFGGDNGAPTFLKYSSDSLWNYETGVKLTPAKGLNVDLTAFMMDWDKAQFTFIYQPPNTTLPATATGNVGKAKIKGLELAIQYRLMPELDVGGIVAYTDAKTTNDVQGSAGLIPAGSKLPNTPKLQTGVQATYKFEGPFGSAGRFNVTHSHIGERVNDIIDGGKTSPGYNSLDLGMHFVKANYTVALNVINTTDSRGIVSTIYGAPAPNNAHDEYFIQKPRTVTLSLRYDF